MRRADSNHSMALTHQQARELLQKSLQERLEGLEQASLEAHLAGCAECAAYTAQARGLDQRLSAALSERWPEPRYTAAELQHRQASVQSRLRRKTVFKNFSSVARLAGAAVVLLVVIAGLGWLALRGAPRPMVGGGLPDTATPDPTGATTPVPTRLVVTCQYPRHLVVEGETLDSIAARYGVTARQIQQQNRMNGKQLTAGQVLEIPTCAPVTPAPTATPKVEDNFTSHVVDDGETCSGIAFQYGISLTSLIQANGLNANCDLAVGQVLRIPKPTPTPPAPAAGHIDLAEAERLVRAFIFTNQPGMSADSAFPLQELTTDEAWQGMRAQVFKVTEGVQQYQSYAIIDGQVYPIGEGFGGTGVHTLLVTDLNADSVPELVYAYSFGSGIHQSSIGMLRRMENGSYGTFTIPDFRFLGELRLEQQDARTVKVTGMPSGGGEQALGRLVLLGTQLVIAPGEAALVPFSSPEYGISFLIPEPWQANPGQFFSLRQTEMDDYEGNLERACEWEANRADQPYGVQPLVQSTSLGGRDACMIRADAQSGAKNWAIFFASAGKINQLTVERSYAQVIGQSLAYLEALATPAPQVMDMTPRAPGAGKVESRSLGSLTWSEYPVVNAAEDTPSHFEYNARIPETVFPERMTWFNDSMEDSIRRTNAQLAPFGYKIVERKDSSNNRIDLYWNGNLLREGLSMFYPPSIYQEENGAGSFAMIIEDKNYQSLLVQSSPDPAQPLIGNYDLMNSRGARPVIAKNNLITVQRGYSGDGGDRVDVLSNGEVVFPYTLAPSPVEETVKTLDEWKGNWVLEVNGTLLVSGENWNQQMRADEIFNWTRINGKPFFFFRRGGKIHAWYDGQELPLGYDEIIHYRCCEPAAFNIVTSPDALWFHALKEGVWYYVEIKK